MHKQFQQDGFLGVAADSILNELNKNSQSPSPRLVSFVLFLCSFLSLSSFLVYYFNLIKIPSIYLHTVMRLI